MIKVSSSDTGRPVGGAQPSDTGRSVGGAQPSDTGRSVGGAQPSDTGRLFTALMLALFVIILLAMTTFGARIFGATYGQKDIGDTSRLGQSLIANTIHANDAVNAVDVADGPEGPALILVERTDNGMFETRLYEYGGNVVEEYTLAGNDFNPESATVMVASQTFSFSLENNLLSVTTDQGTTVVAMRCAQGGAA